MIFLIRPWNFVELISGCLGLLFITKNISLNLQWLTVQFY